ncbi:MAG: hypothetical protein ABI668_13695 [Sphingorhabdus sp.]
MATIKGRQLGFLVLLFGGWTGARLAILSTSEVAHESHLAQTHKSAARAVQSVASKQRSGEQATLPVQWATSKEFRSVTAMHGVEPKGRAGAQRPNNLLVVLPETVSAAPTPQPAAGQPAIAGDNLVQPELGHRTRKSALQAYAYSYWRWSTQDSGLAAAGQYGGSQTGLIATYSLRRHRLLEDGDDLALLFRGAIAPDSRTDREVALGMRWRPVRALPVSFTAERRFRPVGQDRFAVYLAGGKDDVKLPASFGLDFYAQAGVVSGREAGPFFDTSARASRPVYRSNAVSAQIGGGIWAGGQRGAARLDIGPTLSAEMPVSGTRFRITGDWRFRVAGAARPGDGPALTLSTSF